MNQAIICGNLGKNPTVKKTDNSTVCHFSVATTRRWKSKTDELQEETEWHRVVVWGSLAKTCGKYLSKGRQVTVRGRLKTDKYYDDEHSVDRWTTSIVADEVDFGGGKRE